MIYRPIVIIYHATHVALCEQEQVNTHMTRTRALQMLQLVEDIALGMKVYHLITRTSIARNYFVSRPKKGLSPDKQCQHWPPSFGGLSACYQLFTGELWGCSVHMHVCRTQMHWWIKGVKYRQSQPPPQTQNSVTSLCRTWWVCIYSQENKLVHMAFLLSSAYQVQVMNTIQNSHAAT